MKKRIATIIFTAIIALTVIIIVGCSDANGEIESTTNKINTEIDSVESEQPQNSNSDITEWAKLPSINIESGKTEGVTKAETETTSYEFYGRTEEENINLIYINEVAFLVLKHEYGYSPPKGRIIHYIGEKGIRVSELSLEVERMIASNGRTIINPDLTDSVGALFYGLSRNLLPAWLCSGLELYWSDKLEIERFVFDKETNSDAFLEEMKFIEQIESEGYPAFGDLWFESLSVTYSFVKWLDENGLLNEIVHTYLEDKQVEGDLLYADAWLKFAGRDIRGNFGFKNRYRFLYGYYVDTGGITDFFDISVLTEQAHYLFDRLPPGQLEEFVTNIDNQYAYAKQWLGFEDATPIPTRIQFYRREQVSTGGPDYVSLPGGNSLVAVHEGFHHLLFSNKLYADFLWFTEGLPEAIGFLYAHDNPDSDYAQAFYYAFTKKNDYDSTFDFKHYAHLRALEAVNYFTENDRYGSYLTHGTQLGVSPDDKPSTFSQGFLNSYETAASFVIYMLEIGSTEDFMRLYTSTSSAEEVYGKDFNALYEQWLEFLK